MFDVTCLEINRMFEYLNEERKLRKTLVEDWLSRSPEENVKLIEENKKDNCPICNKPLIVCKECQKFFE